MPLEEAYEIGVPTQDAGLTCYWCSIDGKQTPATSRYRLSPALFWIATCDRHLLECGPMAVRNDPHFREEKDGD
jgi:hypothetical protein